MANPKRDAPPDLPYGVQPRRPAWPLALLVVGFAAWFAFLIWLAIRYPAR